jgi:hypothetical protein
MLPEEDLRAVFASGDYRKSLAENTNLPPDLTEALYASEDRATQDLCLRCGNFPKETLERLITSPSTRIRRSLFVNPHLTAEQRLFLCIEKPIIISTARNSYLPFENDRTSRISPEAQFVLRGGAGWLEYYTPGVLAGNAALAEELKNWPETMTGKLPYRWSPDLKRGIPSPLSLRDIPSLPFVGWWEPGSPTWTILVKTKATQWDTLTATLPDHADAWLRMVHSGSHLLVGMIPEPSGFFLWGAPTSPTSAKISVPPLKSKYQIPRKMRREPIEADLRGCAMLQGGLYALWQEGPSLIGWTQERELGKIPAHRILMEEDLVNNQSLDLRLPEFKEAVRSARGHQLAL